MAKPNLLDRAIGAVAPARMAARLAARSRAEGISRATALYDGAARTHRTAGKHISTSDANAEILYAAGRLRDVSRDFGRNNPYASKAVSGIASNVVGTGIIPSVSGLKPRGTKALQALIREHLDTTDIDLDGRNTLYGLQALIMRTVVESGEALIVRYQPEASLRLAVPLQVRVLEPDFLDLNKTGPLGDGNVAFQGIEFDRHGRRVAYWLYPEHPYGVGYRRYGTSKRVPAEDVIHVYRVDRPGQARGIPWAAPAIMTLWDLGDYEDAELLRQKIAACFAVFWIDRDTGEPTFGPNGEVRSEQGSPVDMLEPGMITRLTGGSDVKVATPPVTSAYPDVQRASVRKIAVGYGVPYDLISGDLSQENFSGGRRGWLEFQRSIDTWRSHMLIPHACVGIGRWFLDACAVPLNGPTAGRLDWTPPRREMIKPSEEILAARDAIRAGLSSRSEEQRKLGFDPEILDAEIAEDNRRADAEHLKFDSDGRFPMNAPRPIPVEGDQNAPVQPPR
ncbi:hypothetical protein LKMONMHP_2818 [Methylobacterium organophilum]|uniref:Phage portal protein n=2 Tax=Methylobacterium organophilum TaxID=410 RepID=A0ABQ4TA77_METOR|nr:hypothetical protein LKMONMHP_2818 [Methylobacterium organophilum]